MLAGCGSPSGTSELPVKSINLTGAGATFPAPLYTKWFDEYNKLTGVKVNYQPIGSGGGISQITEGTVDFGASDGIMTEAQLAKAEQKNGPVLHIPMTSGAVAVIYNLAGVDSGQLKLSGDVLAGIYLKKIAKWNDPAIASLNPDVKLPGAPIAVVFRSDGSGTTYIFTNYLSKISQDWSSQGGNATSVKWPGDIGGQGKAKERCRQLC
jgi:phosphate transport system substrate-binding protein